MALTVTQIQQLYTAYLGRAVDQEGVDYWTDAELDLTVADLRFNLANENQPEYVELYGNLSREDLVKAIYQNMFNRPADDDGLAYWTTGEGSVVPANELQQLFIEAASDEDKAAFEAEVQADLEEYEAGDTSELTAAVAAYQAALNDQSEALTALNDFAEESETFDGTFEATEESANSAIELAKDNLAAEQATLAVARASADYDAALDAADATDTGDATADFLSEELNDRALSDARLQQALEAAEANVDESEVQYLYTDADGDAVEAVDAQDSLVYQLEDGDYTADGDADGAELVGYLVDEDGAPTDASADGALDDPEIASFVSSRDLLNNVVAAENALNSDIAANGETLELAGELSDAIGSYLARNNDPTAGTTLESFQTAYLDATAEDADAADLAALSDAVTDAYNALFDEDGEAVEDALEEGERADAVLNLLAEAQERVELEANVATAEAAFVSTPEGEILRDIEALDEQRQADIEDVNQAEADLAEVTDLAEALKAAIDEVEGAATLLEEEYGVENLIELTNQGNEGGVRDEGDIYLVSEDTETTTLTRFEADDRLFIGGDYELEALGDDEIGDRVGAVDQLEVFWEQNGSNLVLYVEAEAAAGFDTGAAAQDNVTQITLNGVNAENVTFENGFLSIVEVA